MRKILLAFDGTHFSNAALEFASNLNKRNLILLTGAFLPQTDIANLWSYSGGGTAGLEFIPLVEDAGAETIQQNIRRFESCCVDNSIAKDRSLISILG